MMHGDGGGAKRTKDYTIDRTPDVLVEPTIDICDSSAVWCAPILESWATASPTGRRLAWRNT
jgi:hypothetical protein